MTTPLQRVRDLFEASELDAGTTITNDVFEELRDALDSTLIDGEQVLSPTAEAVLSERIRQHKELGYLPGWDEATQLNLIAAATAHARAAITPDAYETMPPNSYPWTNWRQRTTEEHLTIGAALLAAAGDVEARR
jgi:hypothetical protein